MLFQYLIVLMLPALYWSYDFQVQPCPESNAGVERVEFLAKSLSFKQGQGCRVLSAEQRCGEYREHTKMSDSVARIEVGPLQSGIDN